MFIVTKNHVSETMTNDDKIVRLRVDLVGKPANIFRNFRTKKDLTSDAETLRQIIIDHLEKETLVLELKTKEQNLLEKEKLLLEMEIILLRILEKYLPDENIGEFLKKIKK